MVNNSTKMLVVRKLQKLEHTILMAQANCNGQSYSYKSLDIALHELDDIKALIINK